MMYHRKLPQMFSVIYGQGIEDCIIVYSIYKDRKNSISVFVGKTPIHRSEQNDREVVNCFLAHHPMFSLKYDYLNFCWPCVEKSKYLIAVFKHKREWLLNFKPEKLFYKQKNKEQFYAWLENEDKLGHWSTQ